MYTYKREFLWHDQRSVASYILPVIGWDNEQPPFTILPFLFFPLTFIFLYNVLISGKYGYILKKNKKLLYGECVYKLSTLGNQTCCLGIMTLFRACRVLATITTSGTSTR